jgi:hypothetical protein
LFFRVGERFECGEFAGHGSVSEEGGMPARFVLRGWLAEDRKINQSDVIDGR